MALTQVAAFEVNRAAQTTIPIPIGSGAGAAIQPGDLLLISGQWANNGSAAPSVSWGGATPVTGLTNRVVWSSPSSGSVSSGVYSWVVESGVTSITLTLSPNDDGNVEVWALRDWNGVHVATQAWSAASETGSPPSRTTPNLSDVPAGSLVYAGIDMASGSEAVTAVGGTILLDGDERNGIVAAYGATSSAGTVTGKTFTWPTSGAYRVRTWILAVSPAAVPTVQYANVGATTDDGFTVAVKALNADEVQVRAGGVTGTAAEVDSNGWAHATISGLDADTEYEYDLILDSTEFNDYATTRTFPTVGTPVSFGFAFGSCFNPTTISGTDEGSFDRILARDPALWIHGGDYHYQDNTSTSTSSHIADMEKSLAYSAGLRALHSAAPVLYSPGDHDYGGNNVFPGSYTNATRAAKLAVMPFYDRPDSTALYHAVVYGRVRFIMCDTRSKAVEDTTRLGSTQLAWLEAQLLEPEPVKFVWVDNCWIDERPTDPGDDTWEHFDDERAEIVGYIQNAVGQVIIIHGDQHCIAADDGSGNPFGGVPVVSGAPFKQNASHKTVNGNADWSEGSWPTSGSAGVEQYMWVDVTDEGTDTITVNFTGYDTDDVARVTLEVVAEVATQEVTGTLTATVPTVSVEAPTASWSGVSAVPEYTGTLTVSTPVVAVDAPTVTWSATSTVPEFTGTLEADTPEVEVAAPTVAWSGSTGTPEFTGTLTADTPTVEVDAPTAAWSATSTVPGFVGTLEADTPTVTIGGPTVSWSATSTVPEFTGTLTVDTPGVEVAAPTVTWTGGYTPPGAVGGSLTADTPPVEVGATTVAWSATSTVPEYAGTLTATLPTLEVDATTGAWSGTVLAPSGATLVATLPQVSVDAPTIVWVGVSEAPTIGGLAATLPGVAVAAPTVVWAGGFSEAPLPPIPVTPTLTQAPARTLTAVVARTLTEPE